MVWQDVASSEKDLVKQDGDFFNSKYFLLLSLIITLTMAVGMTIQCCRWIRKRKVRDARRKYFEVRFIHSFVDSLIHSFFLFYQQKNSNLFTSTPPNIPWNGDGCCLDRTDLLDNYKKLFYFLQMISSK